MSVDHFVAAKVPSDGPQGRTIAAVEIGNASLFLEMNRYAPTVFNYFPLLPCLVALAQNEMPKPAYDFALAREARIKLAESAAPDEISSKAAVYVLERSGYVKIRESSNGFSCLVDRQTPWNSEPTCFDAERSATTLPTRLFVEEERAKGKSEEQIKAELEEGYKTGKIQGSGEARNRIYVVGQPVPSHQKSDSSRATAPHVLRAVCDR